MRVVDVFLFANVISFLLDFSDSSQHVQESRLYETVVEMRGVILFISSKWRQRKLWREERRTEYYSVVSVWNELVLPIVLSTLQNTWKQSPRFAIGFRHTEYGVEEGDGPANFHFLLRDLEFWHRPQAPPKNFGPPRPHKCQTWPNRLQFPGN